MNDKIPQVKIALFDRGEDPRPEIRQIIDGPLEHGPLGFTHYGWLHEPPFEYQLEELLHEVATDHPTVVRAEARDGRWWLKQGDRFVLQTRDGAFRTP